jgi:hypothetical protein
LPRRCRRGHFPNGLKVAEAEDDVLVMGEFANADDAELVW